MTQAEVMTYRRSLPPSAFRLILDSGFRGAYNEHGFLTAGTSQESKSWPAKIKVCRSR